jgi:hypothetical protein
MSTISHPKGINLVKGIVAGMRQWPADQWVKLIIEVLDLLERTVPDVRDDPRIMALVIEALYYRLEIKRSTGSWEQ